MDVSTNHGRLDVPSASLPSHSFGTGRTGLVTEELLDAAVGSIVSPQNDSAFCEFCDIISRPQ